MHAGISCVPSVFSAGPCQERVFSERLCVRIHHDKLIFSDWSAPRKKIDRGYRPCLPGSDLHVLGAGRQRQVRLEPATDQRTRWASGCCTRNDFLQVVESAVHQVIGEHKADDCEFVTQQAWHRRIQKVFNRGKQTRSIGRPEDDGGHVRRSKTVPRDNEVEWWRCESPLRIAT